MVLINRLVSHLVTDDFCVKPVQVRVSGATTHSRDRRCIGQP